MTLPLRSTNTAPPMVLHGSRRRRSPRSATPCPETGRSHRWKFDINRNLWVCACGATDGADEHAAEDFLNG